MWIFRVFLDVRQPLKSRSGKLISNMRERMPNLFFISVGVWERSDQ